MSVRGLIFVTLVLVTFLATLESLSVLDILLFFAPSLLLLLADLIDLLLADELIELPGIF